MKLAPVLISKALPRLLVLTAFGICQQQLAEHGADPRLLALGISEVLLGHLSGDVVIEWFRHLTEHEFDSMDHVIADAIQRVCAHHASGLGDVRARWKSLAKLQRAELNQLTSEEIVPFLAGQDTPPLDEMQALAGYLAEKSGPLPFFRHRLDTEGRDRLAQALCTTLPYEIKRVLSEDKSQQPWRETLLDLVIATLRESKATHERVVQLHPKVDTIGEDVAVIRARVERMSQSDSREPPSNLFGAIPLHTDDFVELDNLLQRLHDGFQSADPRQWGQVLVGDGGLGKTRAAAEYCHRFQADYKALLWISAGDRAALDAGLVEIAKHLGILAEKEAPLGKHLDQTLDWLAERKDYLLVLDGVEDFEAVEATFPKPVRGRWLVTSRLQDTAPITFLRSVSMPEMDEPTAVAFLFRRAQRQPQDQAECEEATRLAIALDACPLLLELAAVSLFRRQDRSFAAFRADFMQRRLAKFSEIKDPRLAAALTLYDRLLEDLKVSRALLDHIVLLAPEWITVPVLQALSRANLQRLPYAVSELEKTSLVRRNSGEQSWTMHRLVQEAVQQRMSVANRNAYILDVIDKLEGLLPPPTVEDWTRIEPILVHALVLAEYVDRFKLKSVKAGVLAQRACLYLMRSERYPAAVSLLTLLNAKELALSVDAAMLAKLVEMALSIETLDMVRTLNNLAALYKYQGRYSEAEPLLVRALAIWEKVLGPEHPDTASSLNNLAGLYDDQGRYSEAEPLYARALTIREKVLGPEHPDTARSLGNLAGLYDDQGRYSEAEPLYARALAIREKVLGPEHPHTAATRIAFARLQAAMRHQANEQADDSPAS